MIVQIYEVSNPTEAEVLAKSGVDHIGVLVGKGDYPRELNNKQAQEIFKILPKETKKVALSLSKNLNDIYKIIEETKPDILHLGTMSENISSDDVLKIKEKYPNLEVMRTIPVTDKSSIELAKQYDNIADSLLLDSYEAKDKQLGATGQVHDWSISQQIVNSVNIPVILAGGLGPNNVAEAIKKVKPAGVDSKTKTDKKGTHQKDINKVKKFIEIAKSY